MSSAQIEPFLADRYAPITSAIGFIRLPLWDAAEAVAAWWRSIAPPVTTEGLDDPFPDALCRLTPLEIGVRSRALLVSQGEWTACFDSLATGTDPISTLIALCQLNQCAGVAVVAIPDGTQRAGSLQFQMFGSQRTHFLNYVRTVGIARDDDRWRFDAIGDPQPFEEPEAYGARRIDERLSTDMVARYCAALGFAPFDPTAYGNAVLVRASPRVKGGIRHVSLKARQRALGIEFTESSCDEAGFTSAVMT